MINVNIGINKHREDYSKTVQSIEQQLNSQGIYFDNAGSSSDTHNINAGFHDNAQGSRFAHAVVSKVDCLDTETF
jgi:hypothetical protein